MDTGIVLRLRRIWKHDRAVIIPFDHGQYGGVPEGLEHPEKLTEEIASTPADAVLVTPGMLRQIAPFLGSLGVILRLDGAFTKYTPVAGDYETVCSVTDALRMGADAGIVFTFVGTDFDAASLSRLGTVAQEAERSGFPLISEVLAPSLLNNHFERKVFKATSGGSPDDETTTVARIAAEHGAGIVKTRYSGSVKGFRRTVETCGAKVVVAGGPTSGDKNDDGLLKLAYDSVQAGAAGVVFGRSVWQRPRMKALIRALCAIVHEGASVSSAAKLLR
ncbi:MAG: hypothetical protein HY563_05200 [Ignavibacteriales bacterium]|nr:hypothetical protein [Ignavibacteriales bacterium]